jgi:hypothetical protein
MEKQGEPRVGVGISINLARKSLQIFPSAVGQKRYQLMLFAVHLLKVLHYPSKSNIELLQRNTRKFPE